MPREQAEKLLQLAAVETRERIRNDRRRASVQLGPALERAEKKLLDPKLTAEKLVGGDKNVAARFAQELERPPWDYVIEGRMETAARLLRDTDLKVYRIAMLLHYSSAQAFGRAFKRWSGGLPPKDYRRRSREAASGETLAAAEPPPSPAAPPASDLLGQVEIALEGDLESGEVRTLLTRVQSRFRLLYPDAMPAALRPVAGAELAEASMAQTLWQRIERRPFDEQRRTIRTQLGFVTPALYRFLCEKALTVCLEDAERGVEIARLVPVAIEGIADHVGDLLPTLWVQAWSVLGNCLRTAGDHDGAEEAFAAAWEELIAAGTAVEPWFLMQLCLFEASLRIMQNRLGDVHVLLTIVNFILETPDPEKLRRVQEAALLAAHREDDDDEAEEQGDPL